MTYRVLLDEVAATMEPAAAAALDAELVADSNASARRYAAELAVFHPEWAATLLMAYLQDECWTFEPPDGRDNWDRLCDAWERCLVSHAHWAAWRP